MVIFVSDLRHKMKMRNNNNNSHYTFILKSKHAIFIDMFLNPHPTESPIVVSVGTFS